MASGKKISDTTENDRTYWIDHVTIRDFHYIIDASILPDSVTFAM